MRAVVPACKIVVDGVCRIKQSYARSSVVFDVLYMSRALDRRVYGGFARVIYASRMYVSRKSMSSSPSDLSASR